jgi:Excalibur calcium-binding domain
VKIPVIRVVLAALATVAAALGIGVMVAPAALADPPYANCKAAAQDGRYNIPRGDPAYQQKLDRDNDGIACESH